MYDKASIALIPSGTKTGKLYSVLPANDDGDFIFERGTTATRVNKDGLIESVSADIPRLDYPLTNGVVGDCPHLLLEPSRTNLITYSEDFSQWTATGNTSVSSNDSISPDGTLNASTVSGLTGSGSNDLRFSLSTNPANKTYTFSVYLKGEGTLRLHLSNNVDNTASSIVTLTSSWVRYELIHTFNSTSASLTALLDDSGATATQYKIWGTQLEEGSYATSYIPTIGLAETRIGDVCYNSGTSAEFNDSEGVLFAEIEALANDTTFRQMSINGGTTNTVRILYGTTSNQIRAFLQVNSSTKADISYISNDITENTKIAFKYKENDFALWVNGVERGTDINGSVFTNGTLDTFDFNDNGSGGSPFYGKVKQLIYFNEALSDSELQTLTS